MSQKGFFEGQGLNIQMIKQQAQQELGLAGGGSLPEGKTILTNEMLEYFKETDSSDRTAVIVPEPFRPRVGKVELGKFNVDVFDAMKDFSFNSAKGKIDFEFSGNGTIGELWIGSEPESFYPRLINNNFTGRIGFATIVPLAEMDDTNVQDVFQLGSDEKSFEMFRSTIMNNCDNFDSTGFCVKSILEFIQKVFQEDPELTQDHVLLLKNNTFEEGSKYIMTQDEGQGASLFIKDINCSLSFIQLTMDLLNKISDYKGLNCNSCNCSESEISFGGKTEFIRVVDLVSDTLTTININDNVKEIQCLNVFTPITLNINTNTPITAFKKSIELPEGSTVNIYGDASDYPNYTQWFSTRSPLPTINFLPKV